MTTTDGLQQIVLILSVANVILPLVFGFLMWKMSQYFVSKREMEEMRKGFSEAFEESKESRRHMEQDIMELLQRTAGLR